jgi:hypothetical protein
VSVSHRLSSFCFGSIFFSFLCLFLLLCVYCVLIRVTKKKESNQKTLFGLSAYNTSISSSISNLGYLAVV